MLIIPLNHYNIAINKISNDILGEPESEHIPTDADFQLFEKTIKNYLWFDIGSDNGSAFLSLLKQYEQRTSFGHSGLHIIDKLYFKSDWIMREKIYVNQPLVVGKQISSNGISIEIDNCCVCLNNKANCQIMCNHLFCQSCVKTVINILNKCPLCRQKPNYKIKEYLYKEY